MQNDGNLQPWAVAGRGPECTKLRYSAVHGFPCSGKSDVNPCILPLVLEKPPNSAKLTLI